MRRSPSVRSNLSSLADDHEPPQCDDDQFQTVSNNLIMAGDATPPKRTNNGAANSNSPLPMTPFARSPKTGTNSPNNNSNHGNNGNGNMTANLPLQPGSLQFAAFPINAYNNNNNNANNSNNGNNASHNHGQAYLNQHEQVLGLIDAATIRTMQITDDLASKHNNQFVPIQSNLVNQQQLLNQNITALNNIALNNVSNVAPLPTVPTPAPHAHVRYHTNTNTHTVNSNAKQSNAGHVATNQPPSRHHNQCTQQSHHHSNNHNNNNVRMVPVTSNNYRGTVRAKPPQTKVQQSHRMYHNRHYPEDGKEADEEDEHDDGDHDEEEDEDEEDDGNDSTKNPWFNEEIAAIVKLHRKTIRKFHRSKTKKQELKKLCKELEKKKRKLIKAAKQRYAQQEHHSQHSQHGQRHHNHNHQSNKKRESKERVLPKTHIENVREIDTSLINVDFTFFRNAGQKMYELCDTYL